VKANTPERLGPPPQLDALLDQLEVLIGRLNQRFLRNLKASLVAGSYSQIDFLKTD